MKIKSRSICSPRLILTVLVVATLFIIANPQKVVAATLDIQNFGAKCDGRDDASSVQSAINALNSGDTLNISCQASIGSAGLSVNGKNNITIQGTNGGGFISTAKTNQNVGCFSSTALLYISNSSNSTIKDLNIDIKQQGNSGIAEYNSTGMTFSGNTINNVGGSTESSSASGFLLGGGGQNNTWTNNTLYGGSAWYNSANAGDGVRGLWVGNGSSGSSCGEKEPVVTYNRVSNTGHTSIASNNTIGAVFSNNTITNSCTPIINPQIEIGCAGIKTVPNNVGSNAISYIENNNISNTRVGHGIQLESADTPGIIIRNNNISRVTGSGIYTSGSVNRNIQILNNTFTGNKSAGVSLLNSQNFTIDRNKFLDDSSIHLGNGVEFQAISSSYNTSNIQITNNFFQGPVYAGVIMYNNQNVNSKISDVTITGNSFVKSNYYGIYIEEKGISGIFTNINASNNCFSQNSPGNVGDNRLSPILQPTSSSSCTDPTSVTTPAPVPIVPVPDPVPTPTPISTPIPAVPTCPSPSSNAFTGCYYNGMNFENLISSRTDSSVNFYWPNSPMSGVNADKFSVKWEGNFAFQAGTYTFNAIADDGIRVYVDNVLIINAWIDQPPTSYSVNKVLTAGTHKITVQYYENGIGAEAKVTWNLISQTPTVTPAPPVVTPSSTGSATNTQTTQTAQTTQSTGTNATSVSNSSNTTSVSTNSSGGGRGASQGATSNTTQMTSSSLTNGKFKIGDRIQTTDKINIRLGISTSAKILGQQPIGSGGTVVGGGTYASGYYWWQVNFDSGKSGYAAESYLRSSNLATTAELQAQIEILKKQLNELIKKLQELKKI